MALQTLEEKKAFVQKFNVFDDTFFEMVAKDKSAVEDILRIVFHDSQLKILQLTPQNSVKNLYGRSVRLDALCIMGNGNHITVEIQKSDDDNHLKRTRYIASCITTNVSEPGEKFEHISDVCVVYISKFDLFHKKRRMYHVGKALLDLNTVTPIEDGEHFIYVNGDSDVDAEAEDNDVAELMEYFKNSNGRNNKFPNLSNRVESLKNDEKEVVAMCELVERYAEEKKVESAIESAVKTAQNFGQTKETIIKYIVSEFMLNEENAAQKVTLYWRE